MSAAHRVGRSLLCAAGLVLAVLSQQASAQLVAEPLPGDPRLVVFQYEENNSFRIFTKPRAVTNLVLDDDERVKMFALGDTSSFQSLRKDNHIFIKPIYPGRTTWGTLLTNKRSYQIQLISTDDGGKWYQRVTFHHPDIVAFEEAERDRAEVKARSGAAAQAAPNGLPAGLPDSQSALAVVGDPATEGFDPAQLNFNYRIDGKAAFRPLQAFDNGQRTVVVLPPSVDTPAVFRIVGTEIELLEYTQHPRQPNIILVPRVVEGLLLKLGRDEVRIFNQKTARASARTIFDLGD